MAEDNPFVVRTSRNGPRCGFTVAREELTPELRAFLDEAMADKNSRTIDIARNLSDQLGRRVPHTTVGAHRRGECACER